MTIELGSATASTGATNSADASSKSGAEGHAAKAPGGFMAILAAMENVTPDTGAAVNAALPSDKAETSKLDDSKTADPTGTDPQMDPATLLAHMLQMDPAAQAALAKEGSADKAPVAAGARPGISALAKQGPPPAAPAQSQPAIDTTQAQTGKTLLAQMQKESTDAQKSASDNASSLSPGQSTPAGSAMQDKLMAAMESLRSGPAATEPVVPLIVTTALAQNKPAGGASIQKTDPPDGLYTPGTVAAAATNSNSNTATTTGAPSPTDTFVADQVSYWVTHGVQNAQMKLDGIGTNPVEVSIRMNGNEAHVSFRTDEAQARTALENAGVHLKSLLQSEGLTLTGVSVGTTSAGEPGSQGQQQPRQNARQVNVMSIAAPVAASAATPGRAPVASGSAVDLFV